MPAILGKILRFAVHTAAFAIIGLGVVRAGAASDKNAAEHLADGHKLWKADPSSQAALIDFERAASLASDGSPIQVQALILAADVRVRRKDNAEEAAAKALAAALRRLANGGDGAYADYLIAHENLVNGSIWSEFYRQASHDVPSKGLMIAEQQLCANLDRFERSLLRYRVTKDVAAGGKLQLAKFQLDHLELAEASATLDSVEKVALLTNADGVPDYWRAFYMESRGKLATEQSFFADARRSFDDAIAICRHAKLNGQIALVQIHLSTLLIRMGDYESARRELEAAEMAFRELPGLQFEMQRIYMLSNLAVSLDNAGNHDGALARFKEALSLLSSEEFLKKEPESRLTAEFFVRNNFGLSLYTAGNVVDAQKELDAAFDLASQTKTGNESRIAEITVNLAWIDLERENFEKAKQRFANALAVVQLSLGRKHHRCAEIEAYLARAFHLLGDKAAAVNHLERALNSRDEYLKLSLGSALSERDRLALVQELRFHAESRAWPGVLDTYLELAEALDISAASQYQRLLTWKGLLYDDALECGQFAHDPELFKIAQDRDRAREQIRWGYLSKTKLDEAQLAKLQETNNALDRQLRAARGRVPTAQLPTIKTISESLPPRSLFLDVVRINRFQKRLGGKAASENAAYVGFVLRPGHDVVRIDFDRSIDDTTSFDLGVDHFLASSSRGLKLKDNRVAAAKVDNSALAKAIQTPLMQYLVDADLLIVSPDGIFHTLPLWELPGRTEKFWVEEMTFAMVPNAPFLVRRKVADDRPISAALIVGDVNYGQIGGGAPKKDDWGPLRATSQEATNVRVLLQSRYRNARFALMTGNEPVEDKLRTELSSYDLVHLATHGVFDSKPQNIVTNGVGRLLDVTSQLDSYLVLAKANTVRATDRDDQLWTAEEIGKLDLSRLRLAVLSSCQTGIGPIAVGQGQFGVLSAFHRAGTPTVVSSLWSVNDDATSLLMKSFYSHLVNDNNGVAQALCQAQREMSRGSLGEKYVDPKYWAPFFVSGDFMLQLNTRQ